VAQHKPSILEDGGSSLSKGKKWVITATNMIVLLEIKDAACSRAPSNGHRVRMEQVFAAVALWLSTVKTLASVQSSEACMRKGANVGGFFFTLKFRYKICND
jgi:hypothetical protein